MLMMNLADLIRQRRVFRLRSSVQAMHSIVVFLFFITTNIPILTRLGPRQMMHSEAFFWPCPIPDLD